MDEIDPFVDGTEPFSAFVPAKPVAGAPVASQWGGDVHDRVYSPYGVVVSGAVLTGISSTMLKLPIDSKIYGDQAMIDSVNDEIVFPAGKSGLYLVFVQMTIQNTLSWCRSRAVVNDSALWYGQTSRGIGSSSSWWSYTFVHPFNDGDRLEIQASCDSADPGDIQLSRCGVVRIGNYHGAA